MADLGPRTLPDSGFDSVAGFYDAWARLVYGRSIKRAQEVFLDHIPNEASVLVIGGGTGWILSSLFSKSNPSKVLYLDASPKMIHKAQTYLEKHLSPYSEKVDFRTGNEAVLAGMEPFDIIITPFLLDLFEPNRLSQLFKALNHSLLPGGLWLFTDFHHPKNAFRPIAKGLTWLMYRVFRLLTGISGRKLPAFSIYFEKYGYRNLNEKSFFGGMIRTVIYSTRP